MLRANEISLGRPGGPTPSQGSSWEGAEGRSQSRDDGGRGRRDALQRWTKEPRAKRNAGASRSREGQETGFPLEPPGKKAARPTP